MGRLVKAKRRRVAYKLQRGYLVRVIKKLKWIAPRMDDLVARMVLRTAAEDIELYLMETKGRRTIRKAADAFEEEELPLYHPKDKTNQ